MREPARARGTGLRRSGCVAAILIATAVGACGGAGGGSAPRPAPTAAATPARAGPVMPVSHAPVLVRMTRVLGDDPLPFAVALHADGTAAVRFGGGHGGWEDKTIALRRADVARLERALRGAPWRRLDGHTVTPGGFGGDDNVNRYALFHGRWSTTLAAGHIPPRMGRLVHLLDAIIDGDLGRMTYGKRNSPIPVTPAPPG